MDGTRFDALMRHLTATDSRRGAVKTLAAAGLGLGLLRAAGGEAKNKKKRKRRCRRLLAFCKPNGKRKCCGDLICGTRGDAYQCRKGLGEPCGDGNECAGVLFCLSGICDIIDIPLP